MVSNSKKYSVDDPKGSVSGNGSASASASWNGSDKAIDSFNPDYCKEIRDYKSKSVEGIIEGEGRGRTKRSDSLIDEDLETPFECSSHCLRAMTTIIVDENDMNPLKVKQLYYFLYLISFLNSY